MSDVTRRTLSNGLTVILKEVHSAPIISWWVMYRVGSRNEPTGKTGISHWVEHMMFKGTDRFPVGVLDREIDRAGGQWNAFTSLDTTMYHETLPADRIDIALEAEADRMTKALFDLEETESERTVILTERQRAENRPRFWLHEEVRAAAFRVHGYHHETLGDEADLHAMTRDDLYKYYRHHYTPKNAVAVAVGAFDTETMLAKIETLYGEIPANGTPNLFVRPEPPQSGERRVTVHRPGHTAFVEVAYRAPAATHEDWSKIEVLNSVLTGASGMDNKTSRLYKAIVQSELAVSVGGGLQTTIDPYLYSIIIVLRDGSSLEATEAAFHEQIERIRSEGITQAELNKAKKQARASFAYSTEGVTEQAYWLAQSAALNDHEWFDNYMNRLQAVTLEDVQHVAQHYLSDSNRVVGWLVPTGMEGE